MLFLYYFYSVSLILRPECSCPLFLGHRPKDLIPLLPTSGDRKTFPFVICSPDIGAWFVIEAELPRPLSCLFYQRVVVTAHPIHSPCVGTLCPLAVLPHPTPTTTKPKGFHPADPCSFSNPLYTFLQGELIYLLILHSLMHTRSISFCKDICFFINKLYILKFEP